MRCYLIVVALPVLAIAGCTPSEKSQTGDNLMSDLPLRSIKYLSENPQEADQIQAMCDQWKASQRPITSWPAVVTENCNNANAARYRNQQREQHEHMKRQMGI